MTEKQNRGAVSGNYSVIAQNRGFILNNLIAIIEKTRNYVETITLFLQAPCILP